MIVLFQRQKLGWECQPTTQDGRHNQKEPQSEITYHPQEKCVAKVWRQTKRKWWRGSH